MNLAGRKARRGAEPSPLNRSGSAAALPRRLRFLSALSDSLPFHAFYFSVLCSSPLRILLFRGGYYAGVGQTRRLPLLRNRKEQILEKIAAKTKRQYTDVLQ